MPSEYKVEMRHITKRFAGVLALDEASFCVRPGEIHALLGENGAGKSTLMKILSGAYQRDSGDVLLDGKPVKIDSPKSAIDHGIAVIYQEFMLAPDLSVAENIYIDRLSSGNGLVNWKKLNENAHKQLTMLGFEDIDPREQVGNLSVAYQQVVEICKSLTRNANVLVLDEPTAVLTFSEIQKLFKVINNLKENGVTIIYISHRLEEIFEIADSITVLKDGQYVDTVATSDITREALVNMMVGRELTQMFPERNATIGDEVLRVENLSSGRMVQDVSFSVKSGEVLGFSGLVGAGRSEAMKAIFGATPKDSGTVTLCGENANFKNPKEAVVSGLGMLPEDRKKEGLLLQQPIRINTSLANLRNMTKGGLINQKEEREAVNALLESLQTRYATCENDASSLSGGNQQKIALAKWIMADCRCMIFDEPTRGVDVGAKTEIYRIINQLAEKGVAVIVVSSEMTEIIGVCDRALVMRQGEIAGELTGDDITEQNLIRLSMGVE